MSQIAELSPPPTAGATSAVSHHGYVLFEPLLVQGTPTGDYYGMYFRGLTHKLNNFLAVIQGFSSLILMNDDLEATVKDNLEHMKEAAQGAGQLAERILTGGGLARLTLQTVKLKEFITLVESNLRAPFQRLGVPLQINVASELPNIEADNGRLKEILSEVLLNAAEAVASSGKPGAAALDILPPGTAPESRPGCLDIFIRNTGTTIPPEKLKEFFRPYHSSKDSKHYGIGLTIAAVLAGQMGMQMGVKNENETTTVWISVPVA